MGRERTWWTLLHGTIRLLCRSHQPGRRFRRAPSPRARLPARRSSEPPWAAPAHHQERCEGRSLGASCVAGDAGEGRWSERWAMPTRVRARSCRPGTSRPGFRRSSSLSVANGARMCRAGRARRAARRHNSSMSGPTRPTLVPTSRASCCSRHRGCPMGTPYSAMTSTAVARCWSMTSARSTSIAPGPAAPTTAGCSPPPGSKLTTTSLPSQGGLGAGGSATPEDVDRVEHEAVRAAAAYLKDHAYALEREVPANPTQLAVLAIEVHDVFLSAGTTRPTTAWSSARNPRRSGSP